MINPLPKMAIIYRPDIDGLRAIAILAVVLYHAGVPGVTGGFVGVDMFFVITGYLIAQYVWHEVQRGTFSAAGFMERRIRRIFPALIVMLAVVTVISFFLLLPTQLKGYASSLISAAGFVSNTYFVQKTGYFDVPDSDHPLLHTWSLAVEMQFYIFVAILVSLFMFLKVKNKYKINHIYIYSLIIVVIGCSLAIAELSVRHIIFSQASAFYMLPSRLWEFLVGVLLVFLPTLHHKMVKECFALVGLFLILLSFFMITPQAAFPGLLAILPCLGTALVIYAGQGHVPLTCNGWLAFAPLVFIGLISYSLYLWHWPLLVLGQIYMFENPLNWQGKLGIILFSAGLAVFSWRFIENPIRQKKIIQKRKSLFIITILCILMTAILSVFISKTQGFVNRLPDYAQQWDKMRDSPNYRLKECFHFDPKVNTRVITPENACTYGDSNVLPTWVLWGDSHADSLIAQVGEIAKPHGVNLLYLGKASCAPIPGFHRAGFPNNDACLQYAEEAYQRILAEPSLRYVILVGRWTAYFQHHDGDMSRPYSNDFIRQVQAGLIKTIHGLLKSGKTVVVVYPIPESRIDIPSALSRYALMARDPTQFVISRQDYDQRHTIMQNFFDGLSDAHTPGKLIRIDPIDVLCNAKHCMTYKDGQPLYFDNHHLSWAGGEIIAKQIEKLF